MLILMTLSSLAMDVKGSTDLVEDTFPQGSDEVSLVAGAIADGTAFGAGAYHLIFADQVKKDLARRMAHREAEMLFGPRLSEERMDWLEVEARRKVPEGAPEHLRQRGLLAQAALKELKDSEEWAHLERARQGLLRWEDGKFNRKFAGILSSSLFALFAAVVDAGLRAHISDNGRDPGVFPLGALAAKKVYDLGIEAFGPARERGEAQ